MGARRGRPALSIGQLGKINEWQDKSVGCYKAQARLRLPNGTRTRVTGKSTLSALDARNDLNEKARRKLAAWDTTEGYSPDMTLRELAQRWLDDYRTQKPAPKAQTVQRHESSLNAHLLPAFGDLSIAELSNPRLRKWLRTLGSEHLAEARNSRVVLRHVLAKGAEEGICSPELLNFDGVRLAVPIKKARAIAPGELDRLRTMVQADRSRPRSGPKSRKTHDDLLDAIDLALATSLRISEVLGISSEDVALDPKGPVLNVSKKVEYVRGTGYVLGSVKTHGTERSIPLPPFAVRIIERRIKQYGTGLIFRSSRAPGGPISQNNLRRLLREILDGSDLAWVTPHSARKTMLTAVNRQLGSKAAAAVAGHADDKLIISTYGERETVAPDVTDITETMFAPKRGSE
ncbi:tyrosine-type recombinase/integrase [Leifsonia sp. EB34]|uniref:tyrosine-type recombinase/integrase n=1 Tax=Leifsonia sp. EB34 TaxID=3156303 RepID=UPI003514DA61